MIAEQRNCQNCKTQFTIEPEDFEFYKKIDVPAPTWCPRCRMARRLIWRNEHNLYRRPDVFGKEVFSSFPPQVAGKIYEVEYWRSDSWDPLEYGRDYDFSRSFFEQFHDLLYEVPWPSRAINSLVNSDYCDEADYIKNCYLCFNIGYSENSAYVIRANTIKDSFDFLDGKTTELAYDSTLVVDSFKVFYSFDCYECSDVWLSRDMVGCSSCVGCVGLRKKNYCIFNKEYSKDEYEKEFARLKLNTFTGLQAARKRAQELWVTHPVKYYRGKKLVNCVADNAMNSKNCLECWGIDDAQNLKYTQMAVKQVSDSYDYSIWGWGASMMYETVTCGDQAYNDHFSFDCWPGCKNVEYSAFCRSSSDLFGCVGVKKGQYRILNKQYTKEQYEELVLKIKKQMEDIPYVDDRGRQYRYGEFFPPSFSPFSYNESQLNDLFPLTKEQAEEKGFLWRVQPIKEFTITIDAVDLPDDINDINDDVLKQVIGCVSCKKAYRLIPMELNFLKNHNLPLPRRCPDCRFQERNSQINPPVFYDRECSKCQVAIRTSYAPDPRYAKGSGEASRPEIVYCETCYQQEVV